MFEYRNVKKVSDTEIVMEIKDHIEGWIPYTAIKDSGEEVMTALWNAAYSNNLEYDIDILRDRCRMYYSQSSLYQASKLILKYTLAEEAMFDVKRSEAEKFISTGKSTIIESEAEIFDEDPKSLAEKIIEKSDKYRLESIKASALARKISNECDGLRTLKDIQEFREKYKWLEDAT